MLSHGSNEEGMQEIVKIQKACIDFFFHGSLQRRPL